MTDTPASLAALGIEPVAWHYLSADEDEAHLMFGRANVNALVPYGTETPLYSATDLAPLIAKARRVEALEAALKAMLNATSEHDEWCAVGPIYSCTCDLHLANEQARAALKENSDAPGD